MGTKKQPLWDMVGAYPVCRGCGSRKVVRDAWAEWSMASRDWQLKSIFDNFTCDNCGDQAPPDWKIDDAFRQARIRRLNDLLRHGEAERASIVVTAGVQSEGDAFVQKALRAVAAFDTFGDGNDPHGEHDFGTFELDGQKLYFKIDYFDPDLKWHSADAANPACTHRVLTVMLASEY